MTAPSQARISMPLKLCCGLILASVFAVEAASAQAPPAPASQPPQATVQADQAPPAPEARFERIVLTAGRRYFNSTHW